jgi:hypothetical protein
MLVVVLGVDPQDVLQVPSADDQQPVASARVASTSRTDRPRTNPAMTSDSNALVRVSPLPSSREANTSSVPRSLDVPA